MQFSTTRTLPVATSPEIIDDRNTVAIVDDDHQIRSLLADLLDTFGYETHVFANAFEYLSRKFDGEPSCILLDVRLHGMSGLDLQDRLSERGSRSEIVFMTGHADVDMSVRAMKAGAFDFLQKPFREQDILDVVCSADQTYRQNAEAARAAAIVRARFDSLTAREQQVLNGIFEGLLNKQIAAVLGISEITVKLHRGNVMRKMNVKSLAELVKQASKHSLFEIDGNPAATQNYTSLRTVPLTAATRYQMARLIA